MNNECYSGNRSGFNFIIDYFTGSSLSGEISPQYETIFMYIKEIS